MTVSGGTLVALVAATLVLVAAVAVLAVVPATAARRATVADRLPGWTLWEVDAAAGLGRELLAHGRRERGLVSLGGTGMTLAAGPAGLVLWRGNRAPRAVVALAWQDVAAVVPATGTVRGAPRPAAEIRTTSGARLVLVPSDRERHADRNHRRRAARAELLVVDLRALRDR